MDKISSKLGKYELINCVQTPYKGIEQWQRYALEVIKHFSIKGKYRIIIFKFAKKNISYLRGKVENTKEKFGEEGSKEKGNYLISLFRTKRPWEK